MSRLGSYEPDEVQVLVDEYQELRYSSRPFVRVRLMDLERALPQLSTPLYQAVLLHGMLGLSIRAAGRAVGVDGATILRRYRSGLEQLRHAMNGGTFG